MARKQLVITVTLILMQFVVTAQTVENKNDAFYSNIHKYSGKNKVTRFLNKLILRPIPSKKPKKKKNTIQAKNSMAQSYWLYEKKTIKTITIDVMDPFGYHISDTITIPSTFLSKTGNRLHITTQHQTIRNLLLIKQHDEFDSLLVIESARLIRKQPYIKDVLLTFQYSSEQKDSVDINIKVLDKWTLTPKISVSNSRISAQLNDKNILGTGHEFKNAFVWYHSKGNDAYATSYFIPNIKNSFINTGFRYDKDEYGNEIKVISVDRPFFSSIAIWGAGAALSQTTYTVPAWRADSVLYKEYIKVNIQDYWMGHTTDIFKGNNEKSRTTHIILTVGFVNRGYLERPDIKADTAYAYHNGNSYLSSIGIISQKYFQDKYLFKFGTTEDVPLGAVYKITAGYQEYKTTGRIYTSCHISFGTMQTSGYFSSSLEWASYFQDSKPKQGLITASALYFSKLKDPGKWKLRQFSKLQLTIGLNRNLTDRITINDGYGLDGFEGAVSGIHRILFKTQTQFYAPWDVLGFRFGPYVILSMGMLGESATGFRNSILYSHIGLGVMIKNENLVMNTFQISISFYPIIPQDGPNQLKINSFKSTDFGINNFESGKPEVLTFQ